METDVQHPTRATPDLDPSARDLLSGLVARQGELELAVELLGRLQQPPVMRSEAVRRIQAVRSRPEVKSQVCLLSCGGDGVTVNLDVLGELIVAFVDLLGELRTLWLGLDWAQREQAVLDLLVVIQALQFIREGNEHPEDLNTYDRELLKRANTFLAAVDVLLRNALLELVSQLVGKSLRGA